MNVVINSEINIDTVKCVTTALEPFYLGTTTSDTVTVIIDSYGGDYTSAQAIAHLIDQTTTKFNLNLTFLLLNECSSAAASLVLYFRDKAKILVSPLCYCLIHKVTFFGELPREKNKRRIMSIMDKTMSESLEKYYKPYLTKSQMSNFRAGNDVSLNHQEILKLFNAQPLKLML